MATTEIRGRRPVRSIFPACLVAAASIGALLPPESAVAYTFELAPLLSIEETYTDNKNLTPDEDAEEGFITRGQAGFDLSGTGRRSNFDLRYALEAIVDNDEADSEEYFHNLRGSGRAELVRNHFFVDATARASQQPESLTAPLSVEETTGAGNRQQTYGWSVTPSLINGLGRVAISRLEYTHDEVYYRGEGQDSTSDSASWRVSNDHRPASVNWAMFANYREVNADELDTGTFAQYGAELGYALTRHLRVTGTGGYEENDYETLRDETDGEFWDVTLNWVPTRRSRLSAGYGERFYGETWHASLEHQRRWLTFNADYSESITSQRTLVLQPVGTVDVYDPSCPRSDPSCDPIGTVQILDTEPAQTFFLSKTGRASATATFSSHRITVGAVVEEREYELDDERTYREGVDISWDTGFGYWNLGLTTRWSEVRFDPEDREDEYRSARLRLDREVFSDSRLRLSVRRQQRESTDDNAEYTENAATLGLYVNF